jgi:hypothetical protein
MFNWLFKETEKEERETPIIGIEFYNRQATRLTLWIELACIELMLEPATEYRIESDDTEYRLDFDSDHITLWLQTRFGPKVLKRPYSSDFNRYRSWQVEEDYSDIK